MVSPPHSRCRRSSERNLKLSPWYLKALEAFRSNRSPPPETNLPFDSTNQVSSQEQRATCMLNNSRALSRDWLYQGATATDLWQSLVDLLPSTKRALANCKTVSTSARPTITSIMSTSRWRGAHNLTISLPQRFNTHGGSIQLLHTLPNWQGQQQVHVIHVDLALEKYKMI